MTRIDQSGSQDIDTIEHLQRLPAMAARDGPVPTMAPTSGGPCRRRRASGRVPRPRRIPSVPDPVLGLLALALLAASGGCDGGGPETGGPGALPGTGAQASAERTAEVARESDALHPLDETPRVPTTGLDSALLAGALERAAALPRLHNLIVARHGEVVAERHFRGPRPDVPANVKSVSKSLLSALVGIAVAEGHLEGPDQPVAPFFTDYLDADAERERRVITLGHLLSMSAGLESTSFRNYGRWVTSRDWVRYAITRPLLFEPGQRMLYSTGNSHLVSAILTRATGQSTHAFARERLAEPLGIRLPPWQRDPQGIYFGGNDMHISPRDLLRFGELYRRGGVLEGREIVPRAWVRESWRVHIRSPRNGNGYGLGWWRRRSNGHTAMYAWGYGGQFLFIVPALELTVVLTSDPVSPREGSHNRALHALVDEWLVPAAMAGAARARGD